MTAETADDVRERVARAIRVAGDTRNTSQRLVDESNRQADAVLASLADPVVVAEATVAIRDHVNSPCLVCWNDGIRADHAALAVVEWITGRAG